MISTLTKSSSSKIKQSYNVTKEPYSTGIDVICDKVYNVAYGQVVYIGYDKNNQTYEINIKCNNDEILRYGNIKKLSVSTAEYVDEGTQLGITKDYVHFEYATRWSSTQQFPVRVNKFLYFKQDPSDILEGQYLPKKEVELTFDMTSYSSKPYYTSREIHNEFNRSSN